MQFLLFVGVALAAPQGYNYQLNYAPNNGGALTYSQVQILQQFASQHEQSVVQQQTANISEQQAPVQTHNIAPAGGSQFANQLIQLASHGQQQQQIPQSQGVSEVSQSQSQPQALPVPQPLALPQPQPQVQPQIQSPLPVQQQLQISALPQPQPEPLPQVQEESQPQTQFLPQAQYQPDPQSLPQSQQQIKPQFFQQSQPQPQFVQQVQPTVQLQPQPQLLLHPQPQPQLSLQSQPESQEQQSSAPQPLPQPAQSIHLQQASALLRAPEPAYYNKEYYYLSAPQENYELPYNFNDQLNKIKKNLRVVFIKAPEQNGLTKAALQLVKDSQQPETAIYVLTKQHSAAELAKKLQQLPASAKQKPEVIFIKYRTRQEAEHAQRTIQSQYESLNGPNHFNFENVVPTHNFIKSQAAIEPRQRLAENNAVTNAATSSPLNYLPPAE